MVSTLRYSGDCAAALGEWAARRCQALTSAGRMADSQRGEVIVDPEPRAWETLVGTTALGTGEGTPSTDELERLRSNLIRLRDAVALPPSMLDGENLKDLEWTPRVERVRELPNVWRVDSPFNCDIDKVSTKHVPLHSSSPWKGQLEREKRTNMPDEMVHVVCLQLRSRDQRSTAEASTNAFIAAKHMLPTHPVRLNSSQSMRAVSRTCTTARQVLHGGSVSSARDWASDKVPFASSHG